MLYKFSDIVNENFFDDIDSEEIAQANEEECAGIDDLGLGDKYTHMFTFVISGIPKKYRDINGLSITKFINFVKDIKKSTNNCLDIIVDFIDYEPEDIMFSLNEFRYNKINKYNIEYLMRDYGIKWFDTIDTVEIDGLKFYNNKQVLETPTMIEDTSKLSIKIPCKIDGKPEKSGRYFKLVISAIEKAIHMINPKLKIFRMTLENKKYKIKFAAPYNSIQDLLNKNTSLKSTEIRFRQWVKYLFSLTPNSLTVNDIADNYLRKTSKHFSNDALNILRQMNVKNPDEVIVDEDEKAIRITIPQNYRCNPWLRGTLREIDRVMRKGKHVCIFVEGALKINVESFLNVGDVSNFYYRERDFIIKCLGHNVNELTISYGGFYDKNLESYKLDLSGLAINKLKIVYNAISEYSWRNYSKKIKKQEIIYNTSCPPKSLRIIDHFDDEKPNDI